MRDDQEFNISFVQVIEKHRCIYDTNCRDYGNKTKQDEAWYNVAMSVGEENPEICKIRWRNLRGSLLRYLKQDPCGVSGRYKKQYYLAEYMKFVIPFTKPKTVIKNEINYSNNNYYVDNSSGDINDEYIDVKEEAQGEEDEDNVVVMPVSVLRVDSDNQIMNNNEGSFERLPHKKRKFQQDHESNDNLDPPRVNGGEHFIESSSKIVSNSNMVRPNGISNHGIRIDTELISNPDLSFFRSLLPDMKEMNAAQKRHFKMKVLKLLDDELNIKFEEPQDLSTSNNFNE